MLQLLKFKNHLKSLRKVSVIDKTFLPKWSHCTNLPTDHGESVRRDLHEECEAGLNHQINRELFASYTYFCMANCLNHPDVAFRGYAKFFSQLSNEEIQHAHKLVDFVNMRGGKVKLLDVPKPEGDIHSPEVALEKGILLERVVLQSLEELHKTATKHNDIVLADYLETHFLMEQHEGLQQLTEMLTTVKRAGPGVGLVVLDMNMLNAIPNTYGKTKSCC